MLVLDCTGIDEAYQLYCRYSKLLDSGHYNCSIKDEVNLEGLAMRAGSLTSTCLALFMIKKNTPLSPPSFVP